MQGKRQAGRHLKAATLIRLKYNSGMASPCTICDMHLICKQIVTAVKQISHSNMPLTTRKGDSLYSVTAGFMTAFWEMASLGWPQAKSSRAHNE